MLNEIKEEWKRYKLQIIGAILLTLAIIFTYIATWPFALIMYIATLLVDLAIIGVAKLDHEKPITITKWIRRQFPGWTDKLILIGLLVLTWWRLGPMFAIFELRGEIQGHLFWEN